MIWPIFIDRSRAATAGRTGPCAWRSTVGPTVSTSYVLAAPVWRISYRLIAVG